MSDWKINCYRCVHHDMIIELCVSASGDSTWQEAGMPISAAVHADGEPVI